MDRTLDIGPLRSLVAVADHGGFQRAADALHLSQGGVSQHVRRLEGAVGTPLVERHGRGSRFTPAGDRLLDRARRILELHDETLEVVATPGRRTVTIGATEHAAAQLLPGLAAAFEAAPDGPHVRYRIDRGARLREGLASGQVDLALLLHGRHPGSTPVGPLDLTWYAAPSWQRPAAPAPVSLVAFDSPCELRKRALETLHDHGIDAVVGAEATQLAGVQAAVGAGLGVALMATLDQTPEGLVARDDLPTPEPIVLHACPGPTPEDDLVQRTVEALQPLLATDRVLART